MVILPMIAFNAENAGNFVGSTGKREIEIGTKFRELPIPGSWFSFPILYWICAVHIWRNIFEFQ